MMIPRELFASGKVKISVTSPDGKHLVEVEAFIKEISVQHTLDGREEFELRGIFTGPPSMEVVEPKVAHPMETSTSGKPTELSIHSIELAKREIEKMGIDLTRVAMSTAEYTKMVQEAAKAEARMSMVMKGAPLGVMDPDSGSFRVVGFELGPSYESITFEEAMKAMFDEGDIE